VTLQLLALIAAVALAAGLAARLAYEHHAVRAAQIIATTSWAWTWHRTRRAFINPGTRVAGRDTPTPREVTV
jgi:hypothetical protein